MALRIHGFHIRRLVEFMDAGLMGTEGQLYYVILYYKGLKHLRILVSAGGSGSNPLRILRDRQVQLLIRASNQPEVLFQLACMFLS